MVDGCGRRARRALRRSGRHSPGATGSLSPAHRLAGSIDPRPQCARGNRRNLVGRLAVITEKGKAQFAGSLRNMCTLSDLKMNRLLNLIDEWARANGFDHRSDPPHRLPPTRVEDAPPLGLDLASGEIKTIIWATGYRPDYSWLELPVLDRKGMIRHEGGVVSSPGVYLMGIPFLRRRKSTLIDGAGDDARELGDHLVSYLHGRPPAFARLG